MGQARRGETSVVDRNGVRGTLDSAAIPPDGEQSRLVPVRLRDDAQIFVLSDALVARKEGGYFYPDSFDDATNGRGGRAGSQSSAGAATNPAATTDERLVVPLFAEELSVDKRAVERGGVRITKTVTERIETIDLPLMEEQTDVERVPVNRFVEAAPPVRYEGDAMIVPLLEEVIVTEKRLLLREELHVRKRRVETRRPQQVTLRREEAHVARFSAGGEDETRGR